MDWLLPYLTAIIAACSIQIVGVMSPGPAVALLLVFALGGALLSLAGRGFYAIVLFSLPVRRAYKRARRRIEGAPGGFPGVLAFRMATEPR